MEGLDGVPAEIVPEEAMNQAYRLYQDNIRATGELTYQLTKGARSGVPEGELLRIALEALDRCRFPEEDGIGKET